MDQKQSTPRVTPEIMDLHLREARRLRAEYMATAFNFGMRDRIRGLFARKSADVRAKAART